MNQFSDIHDGKIHSVTQENDGVLDCDCGCSSHSGCCNRRGCFHCDSQRIKRENLISKSLQ